MYFRCRKNFVSNLSVKCPIALKKFCSLNAITTERFSSLNDKKKEKLNRLHSSTAHTTNGY